MIEALIGVGLLLGGFGLGNVTGMVFGRRAERAKVIRPICACKHTMGEHDGNTGTCRGEVTRRRYNASGDHTGYTYVPCACGSYNGPRPVESFYSTPMLPPGES